jgi:hypothetical protein
MSFKAKTYLGIKFKKHYLVANGLCSVLEDCVFQGTSYKSVFVDCINSKLFASKTLEWEDLDAQCNPYLRKKNMTKTVECFNMELVIS